MSIIFFSACIRESAVLSQTYAELRIPEQEDFYKITGKFGHPTHPSPVRTTFGCEM